jgi:hypothetical protein
MSRWPGSLSLGLSAFRRGKKEVILFIARVV